MKSSVRRLCTVLRSLLCPLLIPALSRADSREVAKRPLDLPNCQCGTSAAKMGSIEFSGKSLVAPDFLVNATALLMQVTDAKNIIGQALTETHEAAVKDARS